MSLAKDKQTRLWQAVKTSECYPKALQRVRGGLGWPAVEVAEKQSPQGAEDSMIIV